MYVWLGWDSTAWSVLFLPDEAQNRLVYLTVFNFNNKHKAWLIARNVTAHRLMITILAPLLYKENNANAAIWLAWSQKQLFFFLRISFLCCRCFYITKRRPHFLLPVHQEAGVESRESSANASEQRYASNTLYTPAWQAALLYFAGIFCLSVPWEGCSQESRCKKIKNKIK